MSKRTTVRIPDAIYAALVTRAAQERRTVSNLINALLADALLVRSAVRSEAREDARMREDAREDAEV